jgi:hypothetical protein
MSMLIDRAAALGRWPSATPRPLGHGPGARRLDIAGLADVTADPGALGRTRRSVLGALRGGRG